LLFPFQKTGREHHSLHSQGKTDYMEMRQGLADSGTAKGSLDTGKTTTTCYDKEGHEMLVEAIG
jgi:hypothetical protein